jgi:peptide subunit release factor 1 (eRF1)
MEQQLRIFRRQIRDIANRPQMVLSVYLNVNPAHPENQARAYLLRLKEALKDLGVPGDLAEHIRQFVESERIDYRTLAIFAAPDGLLETYRLQVDVPDAFRWGESYVAPLRLVLEEYKPYGVALLDAEKIRFLVTSLGWIEESTPAQLNPWAGEASIRRTVGWQDVSTAPSRPTSRGGAVADDFDARIDAHTHQFYKEAGETVRRVAFGEGIGHLILAGPHERVVEFRRALPHDLQDRVVAEAHIPADASEGEILERLENVRERIEYEHEAEMLAQARERGVRGLNETLSALQEENRIYKLLVLWELEGEVRWCDNDGLIIRDAIREECPYCGQQTRPRSLLEALIELATTRGARVEFFLRGENAATLREEFGGIVGLTRF